MGKLSHEKLTEILNANCGDSLKENVLKRLYPDHFGDRTEGMVERIGEAAFAAAKLEEGRKGPDIPNPYRPKEVRHNGILTEGKMRKGGVNNNVSQITKRPPPPAPTKKKGRANDNNI